MSALQDIANLLVQTFFQLYLLALMLRLLLQLTRADFFNPISQFVVKVTSPPLNPLRRIIPGIAGIDMAAVLLILLTQMVATALLLLLKGYSPIPPNPLWLPLWAILGSIGLLINIYFFAILATIIVSWVAPGSYNPIILLLHQLTEPVMKPFRNLIPPLGGLDLSPIFVFLTINVLQIVLNHLCKAASLIPAYVIGV